MERGLLLAFGLLLLETSRTVRRWEWKFNICKRFTVQSLQWLPDLSTGFIFFFFLCSEIKGPLEMVCNMEDTCLCSVTIYIAAVWTGKLITFLENKLSLLLALCPGASFEGS